MIDIKYCKRCGEAFDIDTSKDKCPECRRKKEVENDGRNRSPKNID